MFTVSHLLSSVFVLNAVHFLFPVLPINRYTLVISLIASNLPDIDVLWAKKIKDHRLTPFHAPLLWLLLFGASIVLSKPTFSLICIQVLFHLFFDFVTGRTAGIALFYPFSRKQYSLVKLNPKLGDRSPWVLEMPAIRYYFKNKFLLAFEIIISGLGLIYLLIFITSSAW